MEIKSTLIEAHIIDLTGDEPLYLLLKRSSDQKYPDIWQMVTGKIEKGETAYSTALREIKEETGLSVKKLFVVPQVNSFYNSDDDSINLIPVFVALVGSHDVRLSAEHQKFEWVKKDKAQTLLAWPGQAQSVEIIDDYFFKQKENLNFIEINISK